MSTSARELFPVGPTSLRWNVFKQNAEQAAELSGQLALVNALQENCVTNAAWMAKNLNMQPGYLHNATWRRKAASRVFSRITVDHQLISGPVIIDTEQVQGTFVLLEESQQNRNWHASLGYSIKQLHGKGSMQLDPPGPYDVSVSTHPYGRDLVPSVDSVPQIVQRLDNFTSMLEVVAKAAEIPLS